MNKSHDSAFLFVCSQLSESSANILAGVVLCTRGASCEGAETKTDGAGADVWSRMQEG